MNVLVYGMHWKSQSEAIRMLESEGLISVRVWIGKNRENNINIGKLRRVRINKRPYSGLNSDIYEDVFQEAFVTFLDMFSRNPEQYAITHQEAINLYNYFYDYFSDILHKQKIELLIFHMFPHFGSDYLLTVIAKHMGIKMILMYQSLIPNRFFYIKDLNDFGKFETSNVEFYYPHQRVEFGVQKVQFYMKNIKLKYKSCHYTLFQKLRRYLTRSVGRMTFLGILKSYSDCLGFKYYYASLKNEMIETGKKSVYFPLQMQPEMTTSTLGGIYTDQLLAIEKISNMIPDEWVIHVKENPKQLEGHRGKYFFKRLALLPKVRYLSQEVNSFELIEASEFVATVSGTAGWEALLAKKPALVFGNTWYEGFQGVLKYHSRITLEDILKIKIDEKEVEKDYNSTIRKTGIGIVDRGYIKNYPEYSDEKNAKNLKDSLSRIIREL